LKLSLAPYPVPRRIVGGQCFTWDFIRRKRLVQRPEEMIRQQLVHMLVFGFGISPSKIGIEVPVKVLGKQFRADIVCWDANMLPELMIEVKKPGVKLDAAVATQLARYGQKYDARYWAACNGTDWVIFDRANDFQPVDAILPDRTFAEFPAFAEMEAGQRKRLGLYAYNDTDDINQLALHLHQYVLNAPNLPHQWQWQAPQLIYFQQPADTAWHNYYVTLKSTQGEFVLAVGIDVTDNYAVFAIRMENNAFDSAIWPLTSLVEEIGGADDVGHLFLGVLEKSFFA
jgi:hypothetical protein